MEDGNTIQGEKLRRLPTCSHGNLYASQHTFPPVNVAKCPYAHAAEAPLESCNQASGPYCYAQSNLFHSWPPTKDSRLIALELISTPVHLALCLERRRPKGSLFFLADDKTESVSLLSALSHLSIMSLQTF